MLVWLYDLSQNSINKQKQQELLNIESFANLKSIRYALEGGSGSVEEMVNNTKFFAIYGPIQIVDGRNWEVVYLSAR